MIEIHQLIREGDASGVGGADDPGLAGELDGRGPGLGGIAAVAGPIFMGGGRQLLYLFRGHAGEEIGDPGIGDGVIKVVAQIVVHKAQLGGEILVLVGGVDVGQILVSLHPGVVVVDPGVIGHQIGHQRGGGDGLAVDALAHLLIKIGDAGLQHGLHVLGGDLEDQVLGLVDQQGLLHVEDNGGIVEIEDHIAALARVLIYDGLNARPGGGGPVAGDQLRSVGLVVGGGVDGGGVGGRIPGEAEIQIGGKVAELEVVVPVVDIISLHRRILTVHSHLCGGGRHGDGGERSGETQSQGKDQAQGQQL